MKKLQIYLTSVSILGTALACESTSQNTTLTETIDHPSQVAESAVSGTVLSSETNSSSQLAVGADSPQLLKAEESDLKEGSEDRKTECPTLVSNLNSCQSGKLILNYESCHFKRPNGKYYLTQWNGGQVIDFDNSGSVCPDTVSNIWEKNFRLTRTFNQGTSHTFPNGFEVSINTSDPSGFDSQISPSPAGGAVVQFKDGNGDRTIDIKGIHLIAQKKGRTLWNHTISTQEPLEVQVDDQKRTLSGTVLVQHNLAKYTAKVEFKEVKYDLSQCGCHPISGELSVSFSGSRTGDETLVFNGCGFGNLKLKGGAAALVNLDYCI